MKLEYKMNQRGVLQTENFIEAVKKYQLNVKHHVNMI
jgi:hypothetical protein